jgi:hypothetical protein
MPLTKIFIETYIDFILSAFLNFYAIWMAEDENDLKEYFDGTGNTLSSVVTFISIFLVFVAPFYISFKITNNFENLD